MVELTKTDKKKFMEKQSNITLVSTSVAIVSFFLLIYSQSLVKTNYLRAETFLTVVDSLYAISAVFVAIYAIVKKEKWLWEYVIFGGIMTIGYYFLLKPGISGLPFFDSGDGSVITITPLSQKIASILTTTYVIYFLWAVNVIYCISAIALHTVKYNKIKNTKAK